MPQSLWGVVSVALPPRRVCARARQRVLLSGVVNARAATRATVVGTSVIPLYLSPGCNR